MLGIQVLWVVKITGRVIDSWSLEGLDPWRRRRYVSPKPPKSVIQVLSVTTQKSIILSKFQATLGLCRTDTDGNGMCRRYLIHNLQYEIFGGYFTRTEAIEAWLLTTRIVPKFRIHGVSSPRLDGLAVETLSRCRACVCVCVCVCARIIRSHGVENTSSLFSWRQLTTSAIRLQVINHIDSYRPSRAAIFLP